MDLRRLRVLSLYVMAALLVGCENQVFAVSGIYTPASCTPYGCPSIAWSVTSLDQSGNFTITSSPGRVGNNSYVSFAFANGTDMSDALFVIDCYEPSGVLTVGTSMNTNFNDTMDNVDYPSFKSLLTGVSVSKVNGTMTCRFVLTYNVRSLATKSVYLMLAEGTMNTAGVATPKKNYHFQRFLSDDDYATMLAPLTSPGATPSGAAAKHKVPQSLTLLLSVLSIVKIFLI